ncbi:MAG: tetratricopeptide repeat protein, partial [Alphaproteobacteria bacterium]
DDAEAVRWYGKAAAQGMALAQYTLGLMYDDGQGVAEDHAVAAKWCGEAARLGHAHAQHNLGLMYGPGPEGVARNDAEAVR